jgi:hypothetical protein
VTTALPPALAPWAGQLAVLEPGVALALGPMIHRLDELVGRHSAADAHDGLPDGFDGLTTRGHPDRLLVSQWLLAQEVPDEFTRRAAAGELLYLAPARRHGDDTHQSALLLDCGPHLHGAPRLLQLALALVLHRRAVGHGRTLRLGVLGHPRAPGWPATCSRRCRAGSPPGRRWRRRRTPSRAGSPSSTTRRTPGWSPAPTWRPA